MAKTFSNPPDADSTIQAARSFGKYDFAAAVADLIDNSIYANASTIDITCRWLGGNPEVRIRDNGCGMDAETLTQAMRLGSANPVDRRDIKDLGRFGMGMKTASISQARSMTVISHAENKKRCAIRWDIETMSGWEMEKLDATEIDQISEIGSDGESGTEIIWNKIDRFPEDEDDFNRLVVEAEQSLALTFHRYIVPEKGKPLKILINGQDVPHIDPFCESNNATQKEHENERIRIRESYIELTAFILPHFDKLPENEYNKLAGEEGYIKNQGFYVYRNRRLITYGTWFKLTRHGDMSRLARIRLDIPNTLDDVWRINVDKTDIQLPSILRARLADLVDNIKKKSVRVYQNRGGVIKREKATPIWERRATRERICYKINEAHPIIEQLLNSVDDKAKPKINDLLRAIEETLPVDAFHRDLQDSHEKVIQSDPDPDSIMAPIMNFARLYLQGHSVKELEEIADSTEPFYRNKKAMFALLKKEGLV